MDSPRQALYLTYRPASFDDLTGQQPVVDTLKQALKKDRVAHAYLFSGPRGTGKTTTARLLAKGINCEKPKAGEPDNKCDNCLAIAAGNALDVIEIDAASNRGIDEIRELRDKVRLAPAKAKRKVYIIDEVHMLTKEAFNALLKTLEEPPEHVTFILATTEPGKVPQTIISRCQRFDFRPAPLSVIADHLQKVAKAEGMKLDDEAAQLIARHARGSFRDALSILDLLANLHETTVSATQVQDVLGLAPITAVASLERALVTGDAATAMRVLGEAAEAGTAAESFRTALIEYLRTLMLAKAGAPAPKKAAALAADWRMEDLTRAIREYLAAGDLMDGATIPELPLEMTTLELLGQPEPAVATPVTTPEAHPMTEPVAPIAPAAPKSAAKPAEPASKPDKPASDKPADSLWEQLLLKTKDDYTLSVSLQKTRPAKLTKDRFELTVGSEFFRKKLEESKAAAKIESLCADILGHRVKVAFAEGEVEDPVADALKVFEGAEVE